MLASGAWADVSYRKKLLTASEVVRYLPKGFRVDAKLEQLESQSYGRVAQYDYKFKLVSVLFLKSSWPVTPDPASAKSEYGKLVLIQSVLPFADTNWSSRVHVGEESLCVRLKGRRIYSMCFRQGKYVGYFTLGLERPMSPKELESLANGWLRRALRH